MTTTSSIFRKRSLSHYMVALSIVLNIALLSLLASYGFERNWSWSRSVTVGFSRADAMRDRIDLFNLAAHPVRPVVFFGDSLTANGLWTEWFGSEVLNRGIGGETSLEALGRAPEIVALRPSKVFIMFGVNDYPKVPVEDTVAHIRDIVLMIRARSPETTVYVQSLTPESTRHRTAWVSSVNRGVSQALPRDPQIVWVDLATPLSVDGAINPKYTLDGVHLTAGAYAVWIAALKEYLKGGSR
jgi:lysophospholipase L1-like esterase